MSWWRKHPVHFWSRPKVCSAGLYGALVFQLVLDIAADLDREDVLLARDVAPVVLASRCPLLTPRRLEQGLEACLEVGLLARTSDGGLRITGDRSLYVIRRPAEPEPLDAGAQACTRCHARAPEPGLKRCAQCIEYDAARRSSAESAIARAARSADANAARSATAPQRAAQSLNGTRTRTLPERESQKGEDQKSPELAGRLAGTGSSSVEGEYGSASGTQDTRAHAADALVARIAHRTTRELRGSRAVSRRGEHGTRATRARIAHENAREAVGSPDGLRADRGRNEATSSREPAP